MPTRCMNGLDAIVGHVLGEGVTTIPSVSTAYYDSDTGLVLAVQQRINARGVFKLKEDGIWGPKTADAIKKMGWNDHGHIDDAVLLALKLMDAKGVIKKTTTTANATQMAIDNALAADDAKSVKEAAVQVKTAVDNAQPPAPPEVKKAAEKAVDAANKATTPAEVAQAKQDTVKVAQQLQPFYKRVPWWGWATAGGVTLLAGTLLIVGTRRK